MSLKKFISTAVGAFTSLSQAEQSRRVAEKTITPGMPGLLRDIAAQGAVLLENDGTLPLKKGTRVTLFGRVQKDWFYTGYGSGGDVNKPYAINLIEGMRNCEELILDENTAKLYEIANGFVHRKHTTRKSTVLNSRLAVFDDNPLPAKLALTIAKPLCTNCIGDKHELVRGLDFDEKLHCGRTYVYSVGNKLCIKLVIK